MNSFNNLNNSNFDNLLVQTLMGRLQIRPQQQQNPLLTQSLEDLLFDSDNDNSSNPDDDDDDITSSTKTQLSKEESKLEKEIIKTILSQNTQTLKPNSGQAVTINEHHICVGFHEEPGSDYRVWEWHGHIMLFDDENGYTPEYIYGNYFERVPLVVKASSRKDEEEKEEEEKPVNLGLRELIGDGNACSGRVLHRNLNASSPRF